MSRLADEAAAFADRVFDSIPEVAMMVMAERRKAACWHKLKCERRLQTCAKVNRWIWRWRRNVHDARCVANESLRAKMTAACETVAKGWT